MQNGNVIDFGVQAKDLFSDTFKKFESAVGSTSGKVALVGAAFAGAAVAAYKLADSVATAADEQKLLAERAGMGVKEFGLLQKALQLANVEQNQFSAAVRNLNIALSAATKEDQEFVKSLKAVGINVKDNNQVFKFMIKALGDIEDETLRTRIGTIAFGRSYEQLKPAIEAGTDALEKNAEFAERVGDVFDKVTSGAADDFKDGMEKIGMVLSGISKQAVGPLLPELAQMANRFAEAAGKSTIAEIAVKTLNLALTGIIKVVKVVGGVFFAVGEVIALSFKAAGIIIGNLAGAIVALAKGDAKGAMQVVNIAFEEMGKAMDQANDSLNTLFNENVPDATDNTKKQDEQTKLYIETMKKLFQQTEKDKQAKEVSAAATEKQRAATEAARKEKERLTSALEIVHDAERLFIEAQEDEARAATEGVARMKEYVSAVEKLKSPLGDYYAQLRFIEEAYSKGSISAEEAAYETKKLQDQIISTNADLDRLDAKGAGFWDTFTAKMADSVQGMHSWSVAFGDMLADAADSAISGFGDALADWIVNGGSLGEALQSLAKRVAQQLISDLITDAIKRAIFDIPTAAGVGAAQAAAANAAMLTAAPAIGAAIGSAAAAAMGGGGVVAGGVGAGLGAGLGTGAAAGITYGAATNTGALGGSILAPASGTGPLGGSILAPASGTGPLGGSITGGTTMTSGSGAGAGAAAAGVAAAVVAAYIVATETEAEDRLLDPVHNVLNKVFGGGGPADPEMFKKGYAYLLSEYGGDKEALIDAAVLNPDIESKVRNLYDPMSTPEIWDVLEQIQAEREELMGPAATIAHGGMGYVPKESTYYLDQGERVLSPKQNTDLTEFLEKTKQGSGGAMGNVTVNATIHIMENATSIDQFAQLDQATLRDKLGRPIIEALNGMFQSGITPEFVP